MRPWSCTRCGESFEIEGDLTPTKCPGCGSDTKRTNFVRPEETEEIAERAVKRADELIGTDLHANHLREVLQGLHVGDDALMDIQLLASLTSHLKEKIHVIVVGRSQSGKSHAQSVLKHIFSNVHIVKGQSPLAVYYKAKNDPTIYRNKLVVFDEFSDNKTVWNTVKAVTDSEGDEIHRETVIDKRYVDLYLQGLPVVMASSCEAPDDDQINNRFIIINVDESEEQDERIAEHQNTEALNGPYHERHPHEVQVARAIINRIFEAKEPNIVIPFVQMLDMRIPNPRINRKKFYRIIKANTYLHRFHRPTLPDGTLMATEQDLYEALHLWKAVIAHQATQVDDTALQVLKQTPSDEYVATRLIKARCKELGVVGRTVRRKLDLLYDQGLIDREYGYSNDPESRIKSYLWRREIGDLYLFGADNTPEKPLTSTSPSRNDTFRHRLTLPMSKPPEDRLTVYKTKIIPALFDPFDTNPAKTKVTSIAKQLVHSTYTCLNNNNNNVKGSTSPSRKPLTPQMSNGVKTPPPSTENQMSKGGP